MSASAIVMGTPVSVGHVRPLMPLARRLVQRGYTVVWAISGDPTEPASVWREQLGQLGVRFVDLDASAPFTRHGEAEFSGMQLFRRIVGRANDVAANAAEAIRTALDGTPILCGLYDYFAVWAYVAMRRLGVAQVDALVSAFPAVVDTLPTSMYADDAIYLRELGALRTAGFGAFQEMPRNGLLPRDSLMRVLSLSSSHLCPSPPPGIQLLGISHEALPSLEDPSKIAEAHRALGDRLQAARDGGAPIVLLSLGTVMTRMLSRISPAHRAFLKRTYTTLAEAALRAGAVVVASTCDSSAADLGIDEATLGFADRVIAMPFVPQPYLFARGLVDVMLMHGGANTFHEAVVSGVPLIVCPGFGDQGCVADAAVNLGLGVRVESIMYDGHAGASTLEHVASEILPAMLAKGPTRWKLAAQEIAAKLRHEDGLAAAETALLG